MEDLQKNGKKKNKIKMLLMILCFLKMWFCVARDGSSLK